MIIYIINLFTVTLSTFLGEMHKRYDKKVGRYISKIYFLIALAALICVSGFRYKVGTDYANYKDIYYLVGLADKIELKGEFLFNAFVKLLTIITSNVQILFFTTALITYILIFAALKKYSINLTLSSYFLITTFTYYATMNGIRQYMASALLFYGFKHIYEGNFKKYLIYVLIAVSIHQSAFIMILVYFLARNRIDSKQNLIVTLCFIFAIVVYQPFVKVLSIFTQFTRFDNYIEVFKAADNGANILRILVAFMPVLVMFIFRKRAREKFGEKVDIIMNMGALGMFFMALAWRQVFFARMSMYFDFYYLLIIPMICELFDKKTNRFVTLLLMICYLGYSTILLLSGDSCVYPYRYNLKLF